MSTPSRRSFLHRLQAAGLLTVLLASGAAAQDRPLPEVEVIAPGGTSTSLTALAGEGQWLIFYMGASTSAASTRLLDAMARWELGDALTRVVVVAQEGDPQAVADAWVEKLPALRWVGDPKNQVAKALGVRGAPTLVGVKGQQVDWVLAGVLNDPTMLRDVVRSWIAGPQ